MNADLLRAVRKVIHCDSDPVRQELFERLRRSRASVRLAHAAHRMAGRGWFGAAFVSGYGVKGLLGLAFPSEGTRMIGVASQENARRRLKQLAELLESGELRQARVSVPRAFAARAVTDLARALTAPGRVRRWLRVLRRVNLRHDFLVSCRVASAIGSYVVARAGLARRRPDAVVVSSDTNPEEIAFTAASRSLGIATVFVSHAYPTLVSPPLDFDLSIVEGEAALDIYRRLGPVRGDVCFAGVTGESVSMDAERLRRPEPAIGIFAPKVVVWDTFAGIVRHARENLGAKRIVVRWHPSMFERPRIDRLAGDDATLIVETPASDSLASVVSRCDWAIADTDSNVHLDVLKLGVPTISIANLGIVPPERADLYGFVANRVIPAPLGSLADFDPDELVRFFGSGWVERFRRYDASYMRPPPEAADDVRTAVRALRTRSRT